MPSLPFSQLKLKPNDAGPVNPMVGGSCPPPRPVHAVSTTATMPTAASKIVRRRKEGAPLFIGVLQSCQARGPRGPGKGSRCPETPPACKGSCRAEQAQGIWLPGTQSPPPAPARPMQDQVLRLSSASGCYAHACLRNKNAKPPPDSRAERFAKRPCPHPCNAKPDPTSADTE